jgi:hypothetical protein
MTPPDTALIAAENIESASTNIIANGGRRLGKHGRRRRPLKRQSGFHQTAACKHSSPSRDKAERTIDRPRAARLAFVVAEIQACHDQHFASLNPSASHAERQAMHRQRMASKAALRANPSARAAQFAEINAPFIQKRRTA